ncbi:MAG: FAD/NAD(P)-binding protein [Armatimonadota bacterium]
MSCQCHTDAGEGQHECSSTEQYLPNLAVIEKVISETSDTKTFKAVFQDEKLAAEFTFLPGQFQQVSVFGAGEATFCLTSSPSQKGSFEFSVKRVGIVTEAIHELEPGDVVGVRAPMGNWFPTDQWKGKNLWIIGGGIGMAPVRSLLNYCLDNRADYARIDTLYGARSADDLCYQYEFERWGSLPDTHLHLTIDREDPNWNGHVAFVPTYLRELAPSPENAIAITCGPPIMIKFVMEALTDLGFTPDQVYTTLEMKMKCGVGKCGRCNIGPYYVCTDGPVFSAAQLAAIGPAALE